MILGKRRSTTQTSIFLPEETVVKIVSQCEKNLTAGQVTIAEMTCVPRIDFNISDTVTRFTPISVTSNTILVTFNTISVTSNKILVTADAINKQQTGKAFLQNTSTSIT